MLTPQEVANHAFSKATLGGYNMGQVDEFLDTLTADYTDLYKENAVLKSKMKVLVDKIEEYRSTEEAMRSALLTAQKMANSLVAEAEEKKAQLLREAENAANARMLELRHEIASEELRLTQAQQSTAAFVTQMKELLAKEIQFLNDLPQVEAEAPSKETPVADEVTQKVKEIEESMQKLLKEDDEPLPEEDDFSDTKDMGDLLQRVEAIEAESARAEDADATRRIDFAHLQFGKDYEIN